MSESTGGWEQDLSCNISCIGADEAVCEEVSMELSGRLGRNYTVISESEPGSWMVESDHIERSGLSLPQVSGYVLGLAPGSEVIDFGSAGLRSDAVKGLIRASGLIIWAEGSLSSRRLQHGASGKCATAENRYLAKQCRELHDIYIPQCIEGNFEPVIWTRVQRMTESDELIERRIAGKKTCSRRDFRYE